MTMFTAPPDQTGLILNFFDRLTVSRGGTATGTIINGGTESVSSGGMALFTIVNQSGALNVGGTSIGTTINGLGTENVLVGTVTDTTINAGGTEFLNARTTAIGTIINEGGLQSVSGTAKGTIINGGLESVSSGGMADGVIFTGPHATLALATPSGLAGIIRNWHVGDVIDFLNTKVTDVNETGNKLTVTYGDHQTAVYLLAGQQTNTLFALRSDGHGGTDLILTLPTLSSLSAIQDDSLAITRTSLPLDQATTILSAIDAGTQTETQYVRGLLSQASNTTITAVAVEGSMYGAVGTSAEVTLLATQFLPPQVAVATKYGLNAQVYASEALGLALAFGNETGSTAFATNSGPSNAAMPNTTAGDLAFATAAATAIFGSASTANLINVLDGFVTNWKAFYTSNGLPGIANPTAMQIDLAARGAAWGDAVGIALTNNIGPLSEQTTNFLEDAAQGTAAYSTSLGSQPTHAPFQGADASESTAVSSLIKFGNADNLTVTVNTNDDTYIIGNGNHDTANARGTSHDTITVGNGNNDTVNAPATSNDIITVGNGNNDTVIANSGGDTILLGNGDGDAVDAGLGQFVKITLGDGSGDQVKVDGSNHDTITLGDGASDVVNANGSNHNTITLGKGDKDQVNANSSSFNTITLGDGASDVVNANGSNHDTITLGDGDNGTVSAGTFSTIKVGNGKNDTVFSGGNNTITVGDGNDTIHVGFVDIVTGGKGHDNFVFDQTTPHSIGAVTINNFDPAKDVITIQAALFGGHSTDLAITQQFDNGKVTGLIVEILDTDVHDQHPTTDIITLVGVTGGVNFPGNIHIV